MNIQDKMYMVVVEMPVRLGMSDGSEENTAATVSVPTRAPDPDTAKTRAVAQVTQEGTRFDGARAISADEMPSLVSDIFDGRI